MIWPAGPSSRISNSGGLESQELLGSGWNQDARGLQRAMSHLQQSGWYWGPVTAAEASQVLSNTPEGTFLLRDSYYKDYILTLSMKTHLGPIHLRIEYCDGQFGFDTVMKTHPQEFGGAVDLVQHYALNYRHSSGRRPEPSSGGEAPGSSTAASERSLQMKLTRPLYKVPPSLQHLCRMTINRHFHNHYSLPLPSRLKDFLMEYPFVL